MSLHPNEVLLAPVVSEKSYSLIEEGKYVFRIHPDAHRTQVRQAVEELFGVHVEGVNVLKVQPKPKRRGLSKGIKPDDRDLRRSTSLVALPATDGGAWRAITRRAAASSVAPGPTGPSAPCVLASLGARTPGIHLCRREDH